MSLDLANGHHFSARGKTGSRLHKISKARLFAFIVIAGFLIGFYLFTDVRGDSSYGMLTQDVEGYSGINESNKEKLVDGYLVWSPVCRIPDIDPFDVTVRHLYDSECPIKCPGYLITEVVRLDSTRHRLQFIHGAYKKLCKAYSARFLTCCYSVIRRTGPNAKNVTKADDSIKQEKCKKFENNVTFSRDEEFVHVKCTVKKGKTMKEVYSNVHGFIVLKDSAKEKMKLAEEKKGTGKPALSVMLVGIDSVSRLNLMRTMPQTVSHLDGTGWISLKGYNKVDDNTYPNFVAMLSGRTLANFRRLCFPTPTTPIDSCPLLWTNSSRVTAYAEDQATISTFNYHKVGFVKQPTDYYLRPLMMAAEAKTTIKRHATLIACLGPVYPADHVLNYALDFALTFNSTPTFSLFWMNGFSHNDLNGPTTMDSAMVSFFKDLEKTGALNSTLVVFLSDHGMRFGKIRETYVGYLEERLPFIYFWVPPQFQQENPTKMANLRRNVNRLTSPFDLHLTLNEVLNGDPGTAVDCPTCLSLFDSVPWNRSCIDAGITEHWCTCAEYQFLKKSSEEGQIARFVTTEINKAAQKYKEYLKHGTKCANLNLKNVLTLRKKIFSTASNHEEYVILLQTTPGDGIFEATVAKFAKNSGYTVMDSISRVNMYADQSLCVKNDVARKYCHCDKT